jgi:hypothetical protein
VSGVSSALGPATRTLWVCPFVSARLVRWPAAPCRFNDLTNIDKLAKVKAQVDGVASVMQENIRLTLQRGDRVEVGLQ